MLILYDATLVGKERVGREKGSVGGGGSVPKITNH